MTEKRRQFSPQFKAEAVQMVVGLGRSLAAVARDLEINPGTLGNWVKAWREENPDPATATNPVEAARVAEMESEIRRLRMENEFLKKAAAVNSTCQRNTLVRHELRRCSEPEALPWPVVQLGRDGIEVCLTQIPEIHSFRKILA